MRKPSYRDAGEFRDQREIEFGRCGVTGERCPSGCRREP
jgi:hypothetical protein